MVPSSSLRRSLISLSSLRCTLPMGAASLVVSFLTDLRVRARLCWPRPWLVRLESHSSRFLVLSLLKCSLVWVRLVCVISSRRRRRMLLALFSLMRLMRLVVSVVLASLVAMTSVSRPSTRSLWRWMDSMAIQASSPLPLRTVLTFWIRPFSALVALIARSLLTFPTSRVASVSSACMPGASLWNLMLISRRLHVVRLVSLELSWRTS
mmetsp:Transcript_7856/g.23168  ORF Transcript_7856/g.23168 Transcript_7856/m.23168 type:complete len:208 (-) Transcript_7856:1312-1935(-)